MDYATLQSILGWAAIAAALVAGGIVGAMLVYDLGKPLWRRLARLWRRSPVECVAAVSLLCYCVAWGGGKITFPRTNAEYELLKDAGSFVLTAGETNKWITTPDLSSDFLYVVYDTHPTLPDTEYVFVDRRPVASTNDADWVNFLMFEATGDGGGDDRFDGHRWYMTGGEPYTYTNYNYMVYTTWQPAPAVQTNGVLHVDWVVATNAETAAASTHALAAVPLKSTVAVDGAEAWPNADFDPTPVTARSYVQDGLVAMWDGIENAGWGVHDNNATNWVDLVNGIMPNLVVDGFTSSARRVLANQTFSRVVQGTNRWVTSAWTDNALVFERDQLPVKNDYGLPQIRLKLQETDFQTMGLTRAAMSNATLEATFVFDGNTGIRDPRVMSVLGWLNASAATWYGNPFVSTGYLPPRVDRSLTNRLFSATQVLDGTVMSGYRDGVFLSTKDVAFLAAPASFAFVGGGAYAAPKIKYHCERIYNRALTPAEIAHNAAIDRRRFGTAADAE